MKVKDLINELQKFDEELDVCRWDASGKYADVAWDIRKVEVRDYDEQKKYVVIK